jgi:hypothetical protein
MNSGDAAKIEEMKQDYRTFHKNAVAFGVNRIAENCPMPSNPTVNTNPREWWDLHEYRD